MRRDPAQLANDEYDLLVVGGGIHGACIAWDATLRGLSVALIERGDFGQETSANSLKTVHGGLRYLQDLDLNLVRMMIQERASYLTIAPHLVHPLPCLTPTYSHLMKSRMVMGMALKLNDLAGYDRNRVSDPEKYIPPSVLFSRQECLGVLPGLPDEGVTGGALWHDAQIYDTERLTLSFVLSAAKSGAAVANYIEAVGILKEGNKIYGVKARDTLSGEQFDIRAQVVANAAGPWVDNVIEDMKPRSSEKKFNHSLAINIITRKLIDGYAVGAPSWPNKKPTDNEDEQVSHMLFISPWRNHSLIGTFHSHYQGVPDDFKFDEEQLQNIISEVNSAYPGADLKTEDITFVHHGFLPEINNSKDGEVKLVRKGRVFDHRLEDGIHGLITVVGVKYTTARKVAEKAVDLVFKHLEKEPPGSMTHITQLHNGQIERFDHFLSKAMEGDSSQISSPTIDHLVRSYGSDYPSIRELIANNDEQVPLDLNANQIIRAQVLHALNEEMAVKLSDFILRRSGLGSTGRPEEDSLQLSADVMAVELKWDENKRVKEIDEVRTVYDQHGLGERI
jgi:glycerol-3-phosphate dehydrogenase